MTNQNSDLYNEGMGRLPISKEEEESSQGRDPEWEKAMLGEEPSEFQPYQLGYWPKIPGWLMMAVEPLGMEEEHTLVISRDQFQGLGRVAFDGLPHYYRVTYRRETI